MLAQCEDVGQLQESSNKQTRTDFEASESTKVIPRWVRRSSCEVFAFQNRLIKTRKTKTCWLEGCLSKRNIWILFYSLLRMSVKMSWVAQLRVQPSDMTASPPIEK